LDKNKRIAGRSGGGLRTGGKVKRRIFNDTMLQWPAIWGLHPARLKSALAALPACVAMLLALLPAWSLSAQFTNQQAHPPVISQQIGQSVDDDSNLTGTGLSVYDRFLRARNADRQKSLVADTNKLLRLVNELNSEVARANTGSLTPEQIRMVAEIEKLARNVKDKMSTSVRGTPAFEAPFQPVRN
jgi:hypothetical protein